MIVFVKDIMTKEPISVPIDFTVSKAYKLMNSKGFSQLPVVDSDNKIVGLITEQSLEEVSPSSNLSDYEINYLLSKTKIRDIMQTGFFVLHENAIIETAAITLKENRISSVCVIDDEKHLSGIVTKTDIFKAFINVMRIRDKGTRLYLSADVNKKPYKELSEFFDNKNIKILNIWVSEKDDKLEISIKVNSININDDILNELNTMGYEIIANKTRT